MRYPLASSGTSADLLIEMWAYEACRLFRDKLVGEKAREEFDAILNTVAQQWSGTLSLPKREVHMYVTWGSTKTRDSVDVQFGSALGPLSIRDMQEFVYKAVVSYSEWVGGRGRLGHMCLLIWQATPSRIWWEWSGVLDY